MIESILAGTFVLSYLVMAALAMWGGQTVIEEVNPPWYVKVSLYLFTAMFILFMLYCAYWVPIVVYTDLTTFDFMG
jgi:hypothetical protein